MVVRQWVAGSLDLCVLHVCQVLLLQTPTVLVEARNALQHTHTACLLQGGLPHHLDQPGKQLLVFQFPAHQAQPTQKTCSVEGHAGRLAQKDALTWATQKQPLVCLLGTEEFAP